jgi:hypothetical protein
MIHHLIMNDQIDQGGPLLSGHTSFLTNIGCPMVRSIEHWDKKRRDKVRKEFQLVRQEWQDRKKREKNREKCESPL